MSIGGWIRRTLYWTNDFFRGKKVRYFYDDLKKVHSNKKIGYPMQQLHLKQLLEYATENSPFYKSYKSNNDFNLSAFPIVNKNILTENHAQVSVPIGKIPNQEGTSVHIHKTSGSTGTPFLIPQDTAKRNRRIAELKYFNELVGFKSHEKLGQCRIWTKWQSKTKWQSFKENIIPINIGKMDETTVAMLFQTVKDNKISALRAYASWYDVLVQYIESGKGNANDLKTIKICISSSEALNEETRERMLQLTGIPIVEAYASEEAGMMGQQRIGDTNYYLNHSGYVFEFLKLENDEPAKPGELSRIVITDLFNYAFPLIRYDTGDTAVFLENNEYSNGWAYICKLYGRRLDLVYNTSGEPIHPMCFARVLKNLPGIIQWQFIQKDREKYVIRLNATENCDVNNALNEIQDILGKEAEINIEYVKEIPVLASGKRKPVVCEWKR